MSARSHSRARARAKARTRVHERKQEQKPDRRMTTDDMARLLVRRGLASPDILGPRKQAWRSAS